MSQVLTKTNLGTSFKTICCASQPAQSAWRDCAAAWSQRAGFPGGLDQIACELHPASTHPSIGQGRTRHTRIKLACSPHVITRNGPRRQSCGVQVFGVQSFGLQSFGGHIYIYIYKLMLSSAVLGCVLANGASRQPCGSQLRGHSRWTTTRGG